MAGTAFLRLCVRAAANSRSVASIEAFRLVVRPARRVSIDRATTGASGSPWTASAAPCSISERATGSSTSTRAPAFWPK